MTAPDSTAAIETVFRIEFPRLVAGLARTVGDVGLAEDLAQEALVDALRQWPTEGTPRNPGAWLMTVAKRKAVDLFRRNRTLEAKYAKLATALSTDGAAGTEPDVDDPIEDDLLRLIFVSCHPVLSVSARAALTLRLLGGLTTAEIARAYLQPEPTIAQRIVRAKKTIAKYSVRGDLLDKLGRHREAEVEFERAAALAQNEREQQLSSQRLQSSRRLANDAPLIEESG